MQTTGPYGTAREMCELIMQLLPIIATKYGNDELNGSKIRPLFKKVASPKHIPATTEILLSNRYL